jgi:glycine hydroxymethyltransferase
MGIQEMETIGGWIVEALKNTDNTALHHKIREDVRSLCSHFPVPAAALSCT